MGIYTLNNGVRVIYQPMKSKGIALQATVLTGSDYESKTIAGISHFIEHMLFEGTKTRDGLTIAREIEGVGGELGAFTGNRRTCYYVKCLSRYVEKAFDVLSDMLVNSVFDERMIEKERKVILSEVKTRYDEPRLYQWILFQSTLFKKHPIRSPVIGNMESLKRIDKKDIEKYFHEHYVGSNIVLSVAGPLSRIKQLSQKYFGQVRKGKQNSVTFVKEPKTVSGRVRCKRGCGMKYFVMGYKTVPRLHKDSYVLDVIKALLGKGLSGRIFDVVRNKYGIAYDVGCYHDPKEDIGYFALYVATAEKHLKLAEQLLYGEIKRLDDLTEKEINEAKRYLEGEFIFDAEDSLGLVDAYGFWEGCSSYKDLALFLKKIKSVTKKDILRVRDNLLHDQYHAVMLV